VDEKKVCLDSLAWCQKCQEKKKLYDKYGSKEAIIKKCVPRYSGLRENKEFKYNKMLRKGRYQEFAPGQCRLVSKMPRKGKTNMTNMAQERQIKRMCAWTVWLGVQMRETNMTNMAQGRPGLVFNCQEKKKTNMTNMA
jgi:hypothetical protein